MELSWEKWSLKAWFFSFLFCSENWKYILICRDPLHLVNLLKPPFPTKFFSSHHAQCRWEGKKHVQRERQIEAVTSWVLTPAQSAAQAGHRDLPGLTAGAEPLLSHWTSPGDKAELFWQVHCFRDAGFRFPMLSPAASSDKHLDQVEVWSPEALQRSPCSYLDCAAVPGWCCVRPAVRPSVPRLGAGCRSEPAQQRCRAAGPKIKLFKGLKYGLVVCLHEFKGSWPKLVCTCLARAGVREICPICIHLCQHVPCMALELGLLTQCDTKQLFHLRGPFFACFYFVMMT